MQRGMRRYKWGGGGVGSHARLHLAVGLTSAFVIVSRPLHQLLSHEPGSIPRIRRMPAAIAGGIELGT